MSGVEKPPDFGLPLPAQHRSVGTVPVRMEKLNQNEAKTSEERENETNIPEREQNPKHNHSNSENTQNNQTRPETNPKSCNHRLRKNKSRVQNSEKFLRKNHNTIIKRLFYLLTVYYLPAFVVQLILSPRYQSSYNEVKNELVRPNQKRRKKNRGF